MFSFVQVVIVEEAGKWKLYFPWGWRGTTFDKIYPLSYNLHADI